MQVLMWIILAILFAFTGGIPITNEDHSHTYDFTKELNDDLSKLFQFTNLNGSFFESEKLRYNNDTNNGTLHNISLEFEVKLPTKMEFLPNDSVTIYGDLPMKYVKARLQNTNFYIISYPKTLNYVINQAISSADNFTADYPEHYNIRRINNDEEFENEAIQETKIIEEIEINMRNALREIMHKNKLGRNAFMQWFLKNFAKFTKNKQERYYFIDTIKTSNYTLDNVTITGLWNMESISFHPLNPDIYPGIEMSHIKGSTLVSYFSNLNERLKLNFQAENIYISMERYNHEVKAKFKKYSVINTASNTSLTNDQWESIVKSIEWSIANSIASYLKNLKL